MEETENKIFDKYGNEIILLSEWAKRNKITAATARQKALRGTLDGVFRIGRDWFIRAVQENTDKRKSSK